MPGIIGFLATDEKALKSVASNKRKKYREVTVRHELVNSYIQDGWQVQTHNKTTDRMVKPKSPDVLFEDRVWMVFYNLGFSCMNKDQNCKLQFNGITKQIDVLARDEENIFIIECKSSQTESRVNAREPLEYWSGKREDTFKALSSEWGRKFGKVNVIVAISSEEKRDVDEILASEIKDKNIFLWSSKDIRYIEDLVRQVGSAAKYQLYSVIFANRKHSVLGKECPAIRGKIGGNTFFSFLISAKELLKYAYVHHRDLAGIVEASQVYQRMLREAKLKEIAKFIDIDSGYFPNSIIVNFSKPLKWSKKATYEGDVAMGVLKLPNYFGCAWIIDGQHRLYGAAKAKKDILLPVFAFQGLDLIHQANLFVEINEKQTSVPPNLLWDLYSDIYCDSSDEKQKFKYQVAETAKIMEEYGPFKGCIDIPSRPIDRKVKLSLTTVCSSIEKSAPWQQLKHPTDDSKTPENAARIINLYFGVLKELWKEDWEKEEKSVLLSNNGFTVFIMLLHDIVKHIIYKQREELLLSSKSSEFEQLLTNTYLKPLVEYLKSDVDMQRNIRSQVGRGPQSDNTGILELMIKDFIPDFWSTRMGELPDIPKDESPAAIPVIEAKVLKAEPILRSFVLEQLKSHYGGDKWWKQGIPGGGKDKADQEWLKEIERNPYLQQVDNLNDIKFEHLGLGDMIDIVSCGSNWEPLFKTHFISKANFQRRIKDIAVLRNPISHTRRLEDQDTIDGIGGLLWLSRCLGNPDLNPYA